MVDREKRTTNHARLLIVDDDNLALLGTTKLLGGAGFDVESARGGTEGIEKLSSGSYDLVVTDLVMDDADGIEVLKRAKETDPETMVIVLTGYGEFRNALDAFTYQADDFILKPSGKEELFFRINRCLEKLELIRGLRDSLEANELLVREIHHRMKNNLALVNGLVGLQASYARDEYHGGLFEQLKHRLASLSVLHDRLNKTDDPRHVPLGPYLHDLVNNITQSLTRPDAKVRLKIEIAPVSLPAKKTVPVGLIVTELLTNTHKYAATAEGISASLRVDSIENDGKSGSDELLITYADGGPGFPDGFALSRTDSLGLRLVDNLVKQIDGTLRLEPKKSTFSITVPLE